MNKVQNMNIRTMNSTDVERICCIENECFSKPWSEESFLHAILREDTQYAVAEVEGNIIGYCGIWYSLDDGDLCNMAVDPEYRGQGYAERLLRYSLEQCRRKGVRRIVLEVRQSNVAAINLYSKTGFRVIGKRKGYYSQPKEDAVLMELT